MSIEERLAKANAKVDDLLVQGRAANAPAADLRLLDEVYRPFLIALIKLSHEKTLLKDVADAMSVTMSNMIGELLEAALGRVLENRMGMAQEFINDLSQQLSHHIHYNYQLQNGRREGMN